MPMLNAYTICWSTICNRYTFDVLFVYSVEYWMSTTKIPEREKLSLAWVGHGACLNDLKTAETLRYAGRDGSRSYGSFRCKKIFKRAYWIEPVRWNIVESLRKNWGGMRLFPDNAKIPLLPCRKFSLPAGRGNIELFKRHFPVTLRHEKTDLGDDAILSRCNEAWGLAIRQERLFPSGTLLFNFVFMCIFIASLPGTCFPNSENKSISSSRILYCHSL